MPLTKSQRQRLFSVVIPACSGKSYLCSNLTKYKNSKGKSNIFVDIDEFARSLDNIENIMKINDAKTRETKLFPQLRGGIINILNDYLTSNVIFISSNERFVDFMEVKDK